MIKKTVTYVDFNGVERTEPLYFHFSEAELLEMEVSVDGGFGERVQSIVDAKDQKALIQVIKKFVLDAHGVKSADGKRFMKNEEIRQAFLESPAYSKIFMELATNDELAAEFVIGVVPAEMSERVKSQLAANASN